MNVRVRLLPNGGGRTGPPGRPLAAVADLSPPLLRVAGAAPVAVQRAPRWPWLLVAAAVVWNLVSLRALTLGVAYLNDSSVHEQMVRFATAQLRSGHLPLTSWFPFLGLGSPQFLHYQSLPAMLTGLFGLVIGPDAAFRWSLYLLLSLWPISVYLAARLFGGGPPAAGAAAVMSPFLVSATGIGYEQHAYVWTGFGVWTQLWAAWTLPLAWGFGWRAIRDGRNQLAAVVFVSLTIALHFETGYLALVPLLFWPFAAGAPWRSRLRRAALLLCGSLLASAWVIVPLISQRSWASINEPLQGSGLVDGYGAGRVLGWLASGQLLDHGRLPVLTVFAALGLAAACCRFANDNNARALAVALAVCLLLSFGRATFGVLTDVIPGGADIFFRRFMMGIQLASLLLAGGGAAGSVRTASAALTRRGLTRPEASKPVRAALAIAAATIVLAPAWLQLGAYDSHDSSAINAQRSADATHGSELDQLIALIDANGGGRVYAGMPSNWGRSLTVGAVPVFKYLESRDVDEVGYTLRTASLMTDPEYYFDDGETSDYQLFGIKYVIVPAGYAPPVPARLVLRSGLYWLWTIRGGGYVQVGRIAGELAADRRNIGAVSIPLLHSALAEGGDYLRVAFGATASGAQRLPTPQRQPPTGTVVAETDDLAAGEATATVRMRESGVVVLSASYDPGWSATVDGRRRPTQMIAPALVATEVPAGTHTVDFRYKGYAYYPELFALCAVALAAVYQLSRRRPARDAL